MSSEQSSHITDMLISELLNCGHCSQSYNEFYSSKILPCCGKTICKTCVEQIEKQVKNFQFKCIVCKQQEMMPKNGFQVNELSVKILTSSAKKLKKKIDSIEKALADDQHNSATNSISSNITDVKLFQKILVASHKLVHLFDLTNGEWLTTFEGHSRDVRSVMLLNETKIVTCSVDKSIKIWNIKNGECEKTLKGHSNWVNGIVILSNETIASCSDDETVCIWKFRTFFRSFRKTTLKGHTRSVDCIAKISINSIDSKNLYLLSGSSDKTIKLWDIDSAKCLRTFEGHEAPVMCLDSLTNERVLSSSADKTIKIWNVNNAFCLLTLSGHTDLVYCVRALSDDRIISGSRDRTIKVWCLQTNSCIETIKSCRESEIQVLSNENVAFCLDKKNIKICELSNLRSFSKIFQTKDLISLYYIF